VHSGNVRELVQNAEGVNVRIVLRRGRLRKVQSVHSTVGTFTLQN
jgi:hypothetical protein